MEEAVICWYCYKRRKYIKDRAMPRRDDERAGRVARRTLWSSQDLEKAEALNKDAGGAPSGDSLIELAGALIKAGRFAEAISALESVSLDDKLLNRLKNETMAVALIEIGEYEKAAARAMDAFRAAPGGASACVSLAVCKSMEWDVSSAMDYFEMAEDAEPDNPRLRIEKGLHFLRTGINLEALAELEHAARVAPAELEPRIELADAYAACGRPDDAERILKGA